MSKIINKETSSDYQRWELPLVEDVSGAVADVKKDKSLGPMTAEKIERIQAQAHKEAYEAGFKEGKQAGVNAGEGEVRRQTALLEKLLDSLVKPFRELDSEVEEELLQLAIAIARQLVRREIKTDPGQIVAVVQEAIASLPVASRHVRVHLHPDDVRLVNEAMQAAEGERHWTLVEDITLARGDCRVQSENSQIDATLERRIALLAAQLMGGERENDGA